MTTVSSNVYHTSTFSSRTYAKQFATPDLRPSVVERERQEFLQRTLRVCSRIRSLGKKQHHSNTSSLVCGMSVSTSVLGTAPVYDSRERQRSTRERVHEKTLLREKVACSAISLFLRAVISVEEQRAERRRPAARCHRNIHFFAKKRLITLNSSSNQASSANPIFSKCVLIAEWPSALANGMAILSPW